MIHQSVVEGRREILAEESDIRLHDARNRNVIVLIIRTVFVALPFLPRTGRTIGTPFSLNPRFDLSYRSNTSVAAGYLSGFQFFIYFFAFDLVFTLNAGCGGEGSMTLNELLRQNPRMSLQVVDILREIRQKLVLVLEQPYECVSRRKFLA